VLKSLTLLELPIDDEKAVSNYSLGMKQRLGLVRAMLTKPEILVLDEPMNGLDPAGMKQIRDLIKMFCKEYGITILISSHLLSEIENIADTIGIIHHGKMINEISMDDITLMNMAYIELEVGDVRKASIVLDDTLHIDNFKIFDGNKIRVYDQNVSSGNISRTLSKNDVELITIGKKSDTLEDYFLKITTEAGND